MSSSALLTVLPQSQMPRLSSSDKSRLLQPRFPLKGADMLEKVIKEQPPVLLRDIVLVHSLCLHAVVTHMLGMQNLTKRPLTQSLIALIL
jgi:hypothetical protein